jgi:hypothetical protein
MLSAADGGAGLQDLSVLRRSSVSGIAYRLDRFLLWYLMKMNAAIG